MKKIFILGTLFLSAAAHAQTAPAPATAPVLNDTNTVVVKKDPRVDALIKKQIEVNKKSADDNDDKGYRLMIITTNKREEAVAARTTLYTYFPEIKNYLFYQSPYYKLKAGNFKTKDEADKYRKKMASYFPRGVFLMPDKIEVKEAKDKDKKDDADR